MNDEKLITKDLLERIIKNLGMQKRLFTCEAQFQFALAWELQKKFADNGKVHIHLEYPNAREKESNETQSNEAWRRKYYDIVISYGSEQCVIELKYKTTDTIITYDEAPHTLRRHAAQPLGRYDFLKDVERIEKFKTNKENATHYGYAIILTNDSAYWGGRSENAKYAPFALTDGRVITGEMSWGEGVCESYICKLRKPAIKLVHSYTVKWEDYYRESDHYFRYLMLEIPQV